MSHFLYIYYHIYQKFIHLCNFHTFVMNYPAPFTAKYSNPLTIYEYFTNFLPNFYEDFTRVLRNFYELFTKIFYETFTKFLRRFQAIGKSDLTDSLKLSLITGGGTGQK